MGGLIMDYPRQAPESVTATLREAFGDAVHDEVVYRGEVTLVVDADKITDVAQFCRDTEGLEFNLLSDVTAVDYYPNEPRFAVCYHLYSIYHRTRVRLKVYLPGDAPEVESVTPLWPAANWQEREAYDLIGITFRNHPDLRRILMPTDWVGNPQRKDYPLGYEQVQFSFNFDEIMRQKPHATE
jgi:NADH-quinone oxidoreductase subunit C